MKVVMRFEKQTEETQNSEKRVCGFGMSER